MIDPVVAVLRDKYMSGIDKLDDIAPQMDMMPLSTALRDSYLTDAHFTTYYVSPAQGAFPRCNKRALPHIRAAGCDLVSEVLVFDYDLPKHRAWEGMGDIADWCQLLTDCADSFPLLNNWSWLYFTLHGARLIYTLDRPIPVDEQEEYHRWFVEQMHRSGLECIDGIHDWTRLYRLPKVTRDGEKTEDAFYFGLMDNPNTVVRVSDLSRSKNLPANYTAATYDFSQEPPSDNEAYTYLQVVQSNGQPAKTEFVKMARRKLQKKECFPVIFDGRSLGGPGERDTNIHRLVGQATACICDDPLSVPEGIYALFLSAISKLEPDSNTPDWRYPLWSAVTRIWEKEMDRLAMEKARADEIAQQQLSALERMVEGMRTWCQHPDLHSDNPEIAMAFVLRHSILSVDRYFFLMTDNGRFGKRHLQESQLIPAIRNSPLADVLVTTKVSNKEIVDRASRELVNEYATVASFVQGASGSDGGNIQHMDSEYAVFNIPLYRRNSDLVPRFDQGVHEWIENTFGPHAEKLRRWIGLALAFEEGPICALSIAGPPGCGKKMLVQGLAECLQRPALAGAIDLVGKYQYGLADSPFLVINEGWPKKHQQVKEPADSFRELVSGDPVICERKFSPPVTLRVAPRVLMTANNTSVVEQVMGNATLSPDDREALAQRLFHIDLDERASDWIKAKGGKEFTGKAGHRWIATDSGGDSDFVIARHFLWLYEHRTLPKTGRFLMEGSATEDIMLMLRADSGAAPQVIECLIKLVEQKATNKALGFPGCLVNLEEGTIHVLAKTLVDYWRENFYRITGEKLGQRDVAEVLKSLVRSDPVSTKMPGAEELGRCTWHSIDISLLAKVADRDGYSAPVISRLARNALSKQ